MFFSSPTAIKKAFRPTQGRKAHFRGTTLFQQTKVRCTLYAITGVNRPESTSERVLSGNSRATFDKVAQAGFQTLTRVLCLRRALFTPPDHRFMIFKL